ncbi:hypothetical protein Ais01nite_39750 [Asanoa ishikariensis]|nr:hypothetical protein Ais01nite_39750 [Asanoa ishikariensis]
MGWLSGGVWGVPAAVVGAVTTCGSGGCGAGVDWLPGGSRDLPAAAVEAVTAFGFGAGDGTSVRIVGRRHPRGRRSGVFARAYVFWHVGTCRNMCAAGEQPRHRLGIADAQQR